MTTTMKTEAEVRRERRNAKRASQQYTTLADAARRGEQPGSEQVYRDVAAMYYSHYMTLTWILGEQVDSLLNPWAEEDAKDDAHEFPPTA